MLDVTSSVGRLMSAWTARSKRSQTRPANVLVVDDDTAVRTYVSRVLQDAGYATTAVGSGAEALEAASRIEKLDLLVTDVTMPNMNGSELARRLRQLEPWVKVLYLTGYCDQLFKDKVGLWADEAYLDKPCTVRAIREAVSLIMTGSLKQTAQLPS